MLSETNLSPTNMLLRFSASWLLHREASFAELASALVDNCSRLEVLDFRLSFEFESSPTDKAEQERQLKMMDRRKAMRGVHEGLRFAKHRYRFRFEL